METKVDKNSIGDIASLRLLETLILFSKRYAKPVSMQTLIAGLPHPPEQKTPNLLTFSQAESLFIRASKRAGFKSTLVKKDLSEILDIHLPAILLLDRGQSSILEAISSDGKMAKVIYTEGDEPLEEWIEIEKLSQNYTGYLFLLKREID